MANFTGAVDVVGQDVEDESGGETEMEGEGNSGLQWVPLWKKPQAVINQPDDPQPNPDCTTYICANINKLHQYGNCLCILYSGRLWLI